MNNKGIAGQIMTMLLMIIVLGIIFGGLFVWGLLAPLITDSVNEVTGGIQTIGNDDSNVANAVDSSFTQGNNTLGILPIVTYLVIFGLFIGFIILTFSVRTYPFLLAFWIIGIVILTIFSIFITVAYQDIKAGDSYLSTVYSSWVMQDFLLSHLPSIVVVLGTIGGIILFIVVTTGGEVEEVNQL